jgi:hypothetical protein
VTAVSTGARPCSAGEAVERARRVIGKGGQYVLGTGDYRPTYISSKLVDLPWTARGELTGSDCAGFAICWCYKLRRHRPGFASGRVPDEFRDQSDVDDDINCNSLLEDALTAQEICCIVESGIPQPGDLIVYPSLRLTLKDGSLFKTIGHIGIVLGNSRIIGNAWTWQDPPYHLLDVAQCKGPNERKPAVIQTDGSIWSAHDDKWPKPAHRSRVVRMKP